MARQPAKEGVTAVASAAGSAARRQPRPSGQDARAQARKAAARSGSESAAKRPDAAVALVGEDPRPRASATARPRVPSTRSRRARGGRRGRRRQLRAGRRRVRSGRRSQPWRPMAARAAGPETGKGDRAAGTDGGPVTGSCQATAGGQQARALSMMMTAQPAAVDGRLRRPGPGWSRHRGRPGRGSGSRGRCRARR